MLSRLFFSLGGGSCLITLKYFWWLAKYGKGYSKAEQDKAKAEIKTAADAPGKAKITQDKQIKAWQEKWAKKKGDKRPGKGGDFVVGPTTTIQHPVSFDYIEWKDWVSSLGKNPCCMIADMLAKGDGIMIGFGSTTSTEGATLMVTGVDNCDPKTPTDECEIVVTDWGGGTSKASLDLSKGTITVKDDDGVPLNGIPTEPAYGAGDGPISIVSVGLHQ